MVSPKGVITNANDPFLKQLKFSREECLNQNVHILIPSKFMKKSTHEKLVGRYTYGKQSTIVGSIRTLPCKNGDDEDLFMNLQIVPFLLSEKTGDFHFVAFFHEIPVNRVFDLDKAQEAILNSFKGVTDDELFREENDRVNDVLVNVKIFLNWEINLLSAFIQQNKSNKRLSEMIRFIVLSSDLGKISKVRLAFTKKFKSWEVAYLNCFILRIMFPILLNNFKGIGSTLESLKERLYEAHSDEVGSSSLSERTK
eukprot:TRINITY_DN25803_c0_g1_i1.p1 TRINITY_DN25803_c0_g1~~TRINITY_DN25803_c0_g1_i1.p1  ORF type:complete len:297 (-),score=34.93 TRINITY_DN25803_c0_g1_i1:81-842(-)